MKSYYFLWLVFLLNVPVFSNPKSEKMETNKQIISSPLAGRWYPSDAEVLTREIEVYSQKAKSRPQENLIALILPHAGYQYSGPTAVCGLKCLAGKYKRIIVMGPSHSVSMPGLCSLPEAAAYRTPLGEVPLDTEFISALKKDPMFTSISPADIYEHSVQIQMPLLQHFQKDFKTVPIVVGQCSNWQIRHAAEVLSHYIDDDTLVIASSDFVHYGPNYRFVPFKKDVPEGIRKLDMGAYEKIAAIDPNGFLDYKQKTGTTICGSMPIAILLNLCSPDTKTEVIKYTTSGELTNDYSNSVSYFAIAFTGSWKPASKLPKPLSAPELTEADKQALLRLARKYLEHFIQEKKLPEDDSDIQLTEAVQQVRGAFVTLKKHGQLRGCIGDIFPQRPLYQSVIINALNAGLKDRRFPPVETAECEEITFEISALTVPQAIDSYEQIRLGTDGIVLRKGDKSSVFLPQVAPEQGWTLEETLTHLSQKAGLDPNDWKKGTQFMIFQAEVFSEQEK